MKVYFKKADDYNCVIITYGKTAKIYNAAPSGIYDGVDLYAPDAAKLLSDHFNGLSYAGELGNYADIYSADEIDVTVALMGELEGAEMVYSG